MKKYLIGALLCALVTIVPLAAQTSVSCDGCTHVVSYYKGEGGLIATAGEDAEMVNWLASCGGVTRTGMLTPNDDGVVSTLFSGDLACAMDGGKFEIGPVMDGGWYWITDADNSAVGGLVDMDILDNDHKAEPTGAGDGVTMTMGTGATFLKETSTGRVGILPTILPVMDMEPEMATPCGHAGAGTAASAYTRRDSECMMGDGGTMMLATYTNGITGATTRVMEGGTVTRPGGSANLSLTIDLWGNGTGAFLTSEADGTGSANGIGFARGNAHVGMANNYANRATTRYTGVTYTVAAGGGVGGGANINSGTPVEGVDHTAGTDSVTVTVARNADNCSSKNNYSTPVTVTATVAADATGRDQVTPTIAATDAGVAKQLKFTVVCPAASANVGTELVPENPFPTSE